MGKNTKILLYFLINISCDRLAGNLWFIVSGLAGGVRLRILLTLAHTPDLLSNFFSWNMEIVGS